MPIFSVSKWDHLDELTTSLRINYALLNLLTIRTDYNVKATTYIVRVWIIDLKCMQHAAKCCTVWELLYTDLEEDLALTITLLQLSVISDVDSNIITNITETIGWNVSFVATWCRFQRRLQLLEKVSPWFGFHETKTELNSWFHPKHTLENLTEYSVIYLNNWRNWIMIQYSTQWWIFDLISALKRHWQTVIIPFLIQDSP